MIVKLDENTAFAEGMSDYIFFYSEDKFSIYPNRREKVKFLGIKDDKILNFLDMLIFGTQKNWDALIWYKKQ